MSKKQPETRADAPWMQDGKRFSVGLQKKAGENCYKDFFDSDNLADAKTQGVIAAKRDGLKILVFDRQYQEVVFRFDPNEPEVPATPLKKKKK